MRYLFESGKFRRVMHIQKFTQIGDALFESICGINLNFNRSINAPFALGRKVCKNCKKKI